MEQKSKWWGVGLEGDEEEPPFTGPPPYVPPKRAETKNIKHHVGRREAKSKVSRRVRNVRISIVFR
jgi:hypothetical protein